MTDDCGCCSTPAAQVVTNRPGLSAIAYRMGTFAAFRRAITDELSRTMALSGLTARASDDYALTAIELWSAVADVITFYQERLANEAYLRTATMRDSVLRLVRLIDYQLRPGAATTTQLAFTLEAAATTLIPTGTRVQSVPGAGESPQKFETLAPLQADSRLNRIRLFPRPVPIVPLAEDSSSAIVAPDAEALAAAAGLASGDRVLVYAQLTSASDDVEVLTVREVARRDDMLVVNWAVPIKSQSFEGVDAGDLPDRRAYKLGRSFHLFGYDAPETIVVARQVTDATTTFLASATTNYSLGTGNTIWLDGRYPGLKPGGVVLAVGTKGTTRAIPFGIVAVAEERTHRDASWTSGTTTTTVTAQSGTVTRLVLQPLSTTNLANLPTGADVRDVVIQELLGQPLRFWPYAYPDSIGSFDVFLPGHRSGWSSVEIGRTIEKGVAKGGVAVDLTDFPIRRPVLVTDAKGGAPAAAAIVGASLFGNGVTFAPDPSDQAAIRQVGLAPDQVTPVAVLVSPRHQTTLSLPDGRRELNVTIGSLPTQTITLAPTGTSLDSVAAALQTAIRAVLPGAPTFAGALAWVPKPFQGVGGDTIAVAPGVAGDRVSFGPSANDPATVVALGLDPARVRFLDGVLSAPISGSGVSPALLIATVGAGTPKSASVVFDPASAETTATLLTGSLQWYGLGVEAVATSDGERIIVVPAPPTREQRAYIRLTLSADEPFAFDAASAVLLGNVAPASHGETVRREIVGDGDASQAFQRFALKKKPVTFVPSATPGGVSSSLTLLVNDLKWTEVPTLYGRSPGDEVYITRNANDQTMIVEFGDGVTGARPATGRQNIVATYRQGLGLAGRVGAGKIATLLDRPTGAKAAVNLIATDGGADPETIDRARAAAPGTVRTFGRAVSLRDFEDTALLAGEVAKVAANFVWTGEHRAIHLTVAAQGGASFSSEGLKRLTATLASERDPNRKLMLDNYIAVPVRVDASIIVDDRRGTALVLSAARSALLDALSFDRRRFAEPVNLSDVVRVLQNVDGVVAVDVNILDLKNGEATFRKSHGVDDARGQPQPRLLMLPARFSDATGKVLAAELAWVEIPTQDVTLRATGGLPS